MLFSGKFGCKGIEEPVKLADEIVIVAHMTARHLQLTYITDSVAIDILVVHEFQFMECIIIAS